MNRQTHHRPTHNSAAALRQSIMQHAQRNTQAHSAARIREAGLGRGAERVAKGLRSRSQFMAMMFCQLG